MRQKTLIKRTKWNTVDGERLIRAFRLTRTPDMMRLFLDDLLTENEADLCIRRFQAADMLRIGTPYSFIRNSTGLSPNTIAQISKKMRDNRGGYSEILERLHPNGIRYFD
jgi:uncharacterized protein YerC